MKTPQRQAESATPPKPAPKSGARTRRTRRTGFGVLRPSNADREVRRLAIALLEVLAGVRTPTAAAEALGISVPRYYVLESRALGGFLEALRPRPRGPRQSAARQIERLEREVARLERECARSQALLRVAARTVGLTALPKEPRRAPKGAGKRRRRRPTVRALRAARALEEKTLEAAESRGDNAAEKAVN